MRKCKVKCKKCKRELLNTEAYLVVEGNKRSYYCTEEEYKEIQLEKDQYNSCLEVVARTINSKFVPPVMLKKLGELRQFYNYYIIERTFKECGQTIAWSLENKDFCNEFAKTKYIMSIVANNISRVDKKVKQEIKEMEKLFSKSNEIEVEIMDIPTRETANKEVSDISAFLD